MSEASKPNWIFLGKGDVLANSEVAGRIDLGDNHGRGIAHGFQVPIPAYVARAVTADGQFGDGVAIACQPEAWNGVRPDEFYLGVIPKDQFKEHITKDTVVKDSAICAQMSTAVNAAGLETTIKTMFGTNAKDVISQIKPDVNMWEETVDRVSAAVLAKLENG